MFNYLMNGILTPSNNIYLRDKFLSLPYIIIIIHAVHITVNPGLIINIH